MRFGQRRRWSLPGRNGPLGRAALRKRGCSLPAHRHVQAAVALGAKSYQRVMVAIWEAPLRSLADAKLMKQGRLPTYSGGPSEGREGQSWAEKSLKNGRILVEFQKLRKAATHERAVFSEHFTLDTP